MRLSRDEANKMEQHEYDYVETSLNDPSSVRGQRWTCQSNNVEHEDDDNDDSFVKKLELTKKAELRKNEQTR